MLLVKAAPAVLVPALENNPRLVKILADQSYRGALHSCCNKILIIRSS
jgi:hypothetical protein